MENSPGGRQVRSMQARDHDLVALEPHADDHAETDEHDGRLIHAQSPRPKELRQQAIEEHRSPIDGLIITRTPAP